MHRRLSRFVSRAFVPAAIAMISPIALSAQVPSQALSPKRTLTTGPAPGCDIAPSGAVARRDNAEARRLAAAGQEAALIGDQAAARDAFARAAVLNPGDERIAYDLGRAHEELSDTSKSIAEFCRYLTLSPAGREAADVRDRLLRLVPRPAQQRAQDVQVAFRLGLVLFDDARYEAAARAFDDVVRNAPTAPEGYFNRGLSRAAGGQRADALKDLEQYRANAPTVDDRVEVGRAIEVLRRPVFSPGGTFVRSILPGFGQFSTGRPIRGAVVLVAAVGSAAFAFTSTTTEKQINYVDPNGVPAPYIETTTERPYFAPAIGAAAALTVIGMIEAVMYARGTQRGATIVVRRGATGGDDNAFAIVPTFSWHGRAGLRVTTRF